MTTRQAPARNPITVIGAFPHLDIAPSQVAQFLIQPSFRISQEHVGQREMLDSFVATPSRYVFEMVRRTRETQCDSRRILIFNPLLRLSTFLIRLTLACVAQSHHDDAVVRSSNGLPLAYLLTLEPAEDYRHLLLLSCSNPELDSKLLAALYFRDVALITVHFPCLTAISNGFLPGPYWRPMEWCAQNALDVLRKVGGEPTAPAANRRTLRDAVRMSAFFTHHAGDALFMGIAASMTERPLFDEILINEAYFPIVRENRGKITFSTTDGPIPFRGEYRKEDCHHFLDMVPRLAKGVFHVYCRGTRNYNFTNFHYIDHFRFCLGESLTEDSQLHRGLVVGAVHPARSKADGPPTILLHFDAGWPLKVYPRSFQLELATLLREQGFRLVALDAHDPLPDVESLRFGTLEKFDALLDRVDVVIGMDSFPVHYAAQARAIKTLHLFSSTHPVHSWAGDSAHHRALHNGADCCPCLGWDKCVRHGGSVCRNFAPPAAVVRGVAEVLAGLPLAPPTLDPLPMPSSKCPRQFRRGTGKAVVFGERDLSAPRLQLMRPFWYLALIPYVVAILVGEFVTAVRHEGPRKALYLTHAFVRRHFPRLLPKRGNGTT
ncbi:MAG: hypothetical protein FD157_114 [Rhodocyclaceae bacterium]|nr:MAG: hypothetical protein FD157_114 [Rhodocyclaceae bacterium]TND04932.1 MAG: hypothetical protein FD118_751 [Rhodocyclaceae bacterium]